MKNNVFFVPTPSGRPTGPPPAYPPPPVPFQHQTPGFLKGPPPPVPSPLHRVPTSPLPKKPPPSIPPPSLPKDFGPAHSPSAAPTPPPPNLKRALQSRLASAGGPANDRNNCRNVPAVSFHSPPVVSMCQQFDNSLELNGATHCQANPAGSNHFELLNNLLTKQIPLNGRVSHLKPPGPKPLPQEPGSCVLPPVPGQLPPSPRLNKPGSAKPRPPTAAKPQPPPTKPRTPAAPFQ